MKETFIAIKGNWTSVTVQTSDEKQQQPHRTSHKTTQDISLAWTLRAQAEV